MSNASLPSPRQTIVDEQKLPTWPWLKFFQQLANFQQPLVPQFLAFAHSSGLAASDYPDGSVWYQIDRTLYFLASGGVWVYLAGVCRVAQADLPTDLGTAGDVGVLAYVTDFAHLLRWNGTGWEWGPGENGSDYVSAFVTGPDDATGWHACDGTVGVVRLKSDGSRAFATVPNTAGSWYRL